MTVEPEFTAAELAMIARIRKAAKDMPDDFWGVAAVQELACLLAKLEPLLTDKQMAVMIGVGAVLCRQSEQEFKAEIQSLMLFAKLRTERDG